MDQLDALRALADTGTTSLAAVRLRVTQSAVSKRIAALEASVGAPLVERIGRRLRLTPAGATLLDEATPLLARLRELTSAARRERPVVLGSTESILGSWLPERLRGTPVELHVHRGPLLVERVRSGALDVAIGVEAPTDLLFLPILDEPMMVVGDGVEVSTIEERSLTGAWLARRLPRIAPELRIVRRLESFPVLVRLAAAGLGAALVPEGIAAAMGAGGRPIAGLARPIGVFARPGTEAAARRIHATVTGR